MDSKQFREAAHAAIEESTPSILLLAIAKELQNFSTVKILPVI
jgi:hypothetical protein